ncbi:MAG: hypothetical protein ACRD1R_12620 [Acidobacteriota bacterium]
MEVTSTVIGDIAALRNALRKKGRTIDAPELHRTWLLSLGRKPPLGNFKKNRDTLIAVLREFEEDVITDFSILRFNDDNPRIQKLRELREAFGIWHGHPIETGQGSMSEILLREAPSGGCFGTNQVVAAVEREAAR